MPLSFELRLYSAYGKNFVKTVQKLSEPNNELKVVDDQIGTDFCQWPGWLYNRACKRAKEWPKGTSIYHIAIQGSAVGPILLEKF